MRRSWLQASPSPQTASRAADKTVAKAASKASGKSPSKTASKSAAKTTVPAAAKKRPAAKAAGHPGDAPWEHANPKGAGEHQPLSPQAKAAAKRRATAAGRPYPNLVDNMRAAAKSKR